MIVHNRDGLFHRLVFVELHDQIRATFHRTRCLPAVSTIVRSRGSRNARSSSVCGRRLAESVNPQRQFAFHSADRCGDPILRGIHNCRERPDGRRSLPVTRKVN